MTITSLHCKDGDGTRRFSVSRASFVRPFFSHAFFPFGVTHVTAGSGHGGLYGANVFAFDTPYHGGHTGGAPLMRSAITAFGHPALGVKRRTFHV